MYHEWRYFLKYSPLAVESRGCEVDSAVPIVAYVVNGRIEFKLLEYKNHIFILEL